MYRLLNIKEKVLLGSRMDQQANDARAELGEERDKNKSIECMWIKHFCSEREN
jgi:hypothetical protein